MIQFAVYTILGAFLFILILMVKVLLIEGVNSNRNVFESSIKYLISGCLFGLLTAIFAGIGLAHIVELEDYIVKREPLLSVYDNYYLIDNSTTLKYYFVKDKGRNKQELNSKNRSNVYIIEYDKDENKKPEIIYHSHRVSKNKPLEQLFVIVIDWRALDEYVEICIPKDSRLLSGRNIKINTK